MAPNLATRPTRSQVSALVHDPLGMFREEMDDLMSCFWSGKQDGWLSGNFAPSIDLTESDNSFEVRVDIPGVESKDIDVQVHGNLVTISGERKEGKGRKRKDIPPCRAADREVFPLIDFALCHQRGRSRRRLRQGNSDREASQM